MHVKFYANNEIINEIGQSATRMAPGFNPGCLRTYWSQAPRLGWATAVALSLVAILALPCRLRAHAARQARNVTAVEPAAGKLPAGSVKLNWELLTTPGCDNSSPWPSA